MMYPDDCLLYGQDMLEAVQLASNDQKSVSQYPTNFESYDLRVGVGGMSHVKFSGGIGPFPSHP